MKNSIQIIKNAFTPILLGAWLFFISITLLHAQPVEGLKIGWAKTDITPEKPVLIRGQFHARFSEGIMDPITATALAIESTKAGRTSRAVLVSCDLIGIADDLRDRVRELLKDLSPALDGKDIMINGTHTHAAPLTSTDDADVENRYGISLEMIAPGVDAMSPAEYSEFAAHRIAEVVRSAWSSRKKGGISFGLSTAVIGHNRLQVDDSGKSTMYHSTDRPEFSHIEGYEDHYANLLYTWDADSKLTGVMVNVAVPSQISEHSYLISADFWHDTRLSIRKALNEDIYVLPQVSSAGDQSPHLMWGSKAEERMQRLMGFDDEDSGRGSKSQRKLVASRITQAVTSILPYMEKNIEWNPVFAHRAETINLSRRLLSEQDVKDAEEESAKWKVEYEKMLADVKAHPEKMKTPRWYRDITINYTKMNRGISVHQRYELEKVEPKLPVEVHVLRIGDMAIASNPFELYLDYGIQIKARSAATQTFLVQLAGAGTYLPTKRSIAGGAYGAVPASTLIGPEGGKELVEETLKIINALWEQ